MKRPRLPENIPRTVTVACGAVSGVLLVACVLICLLVIVPKVIDTKEGVDETRALAKAQQETDEIASCSRRLRGPIDSASAALERAATARDDLTVTGLELVARGDEDGLTILVVKVPQVRRQVALAQANYDLATAAYDQASKLGPKRFLAECRAGWPNSPKPDGEQVGPFTSCSAATVAGMTPLRRGDPGYNPALDADGDGVACE